MTWLWKYCLCLLYPTGGALPCLAETGIDEFLREFRREAPLLMRVGLSAGSVLFVLSPVLTLYIPLPVFLLSRSLQDKHAAKLASHPLYMVRQSVLLLRLVAGLCWGKHPSVRKAYGLEPLIEDPGTFRGGA